MAELREPWRGQLQPPSDVLRILVREKSFIACFALSAVLTSVGLTCAMPQQYEAAAALFYRPEQVAPRVGSVAAGAVPAVAAQRTLEELAASDAILVPVVRGLGLQTDVAPPLRAANQPFAALRQLGRAWVQPQGIALGEADAVSAAVAGLRESLRFASRESSVLELVVRDSDPQRAEAASGAIAAQLASWLQRQVQVPEAQQRGPLREAIARKKAEVQRERDAIARLQQKHALASVESELERGVERWSKLELERTQLESSVQQTRAELAEIDEKLALRQAAAVRSRRLDGQYAAAPAAEPVSAPRAVPDPAASVEHRPRNDWYWSGGSPSRAQSRRHALEAELEGQLERWSELEQQREQVQGRIDRATSEIEMLEQQLARRRPRGVETTDAEELPERVQTRGTAAIPAALRRAEDAPEPLALRREPSEPASPQERKWMSRRATAGVELERARERWKELERATAELKSSIDRTQAQLAAWAQPAPTSEPAPSETAAASGDPARGETPAARADAPHDVETAAPSEPTPGQGGFLHASEYRALVSRKALAEVELEGLQARSARLEQAAAELRQRLQLLPEVSSELKKHELQLRESEAGLLALEQQQREAAARESASPGEPHVLGDSLQPARRVAPVASYHVGLAALVSLPLAVALVYLLDFLNVRILFHSRGPQGRRS